MTKKVSLVFRRLENGDFELQSLGVDDLVSTANNRGDKSSGKYFQWKPGNGIVPLALFFVRAAKAIATGHPGPIDSEQLKGYQGHLIWGGIMDKNGSIPKNHPQNTIRHSLINNRHRWNLYLYRLFYQEGFRELGIQFDALNAQGSERDVKSGLEKIERKNDLLPNSLRNEYDRLIFLGCMLVRRQPTGQDPRNFWVYFCTRSGREMDVEIKLLSPDNEEHGACMKEMNQLDAVLSRNFELIADKQERKVTQFTTQAAPNLQPPAESKISQKPHIIHIVPWFADTRKAISVIALLFLLLLIGALSSKRPEADSIDEIRTNRRETSKPAEEKTTPENASQPDGIRPPNPDVLEVRDQVVTVYDTESNLLWKKDIEGPVEKKNCHIVDLDGDGQNEVVIAMLGYDDHPLGGQVLVFDKSRNLKWKFGQELLPPFGVNLSGKYAIRELYVDDYLQDNKRQVLVLFNDAHGWSGACACLLNHDGSHMWTYWHPGHITKATAGCSQKGGRKKIIFEAINNQYAKLIPGPFPDSPKSDNPRAIFMLDPVPAETAPPFHDSPIKGIKQLQWYQLISPEPTGLDRLDIVDKNHNGHYQIAAWFSAGQVLYLDFSGKVIDGVPVTKNNRPIRLVEVYPNDETNLPVERLLKLGAKPVKLEKESQPDIVRPGN